MAVGGSKLGPEGYTDLNQDQGKSGSTMRGKECDEHRLGGSGQSPRIYVPKQTGGGTFSEGLDTRGWRVLADLSGVWRGHSVEREGE